MKIKTTPFDPADVLDTKEAQIELLADAVRPATPDISQMRSEPSRGRAEWQGSLKRPG